MAHLTPSSISQIALAIDGISISNKNLKLGHDSAGSGVSNFTSNRYLYLDTFDLGIGVPATNNLLYLDSSAASIGIGTNTPSSKLEVNGGAATTLITIDSSTAQDVGIDFKNAGTRKGLMFLDGDGTNSIILRTDTSGDILFQTNVGAGSYNALTLRGLNGNVGVNNLGPAEKLDVTGNIRTSGELQFGGTTNRIQLGATNTMTFDTNGAERVRISSAGNVGIGTILPLGKLHVSGTGANLVLESSIDQDDNLITFVDAGGTTAIVGHDFAGTDHFKIINYTSAGNITIGTDSSTRKIYSSTGLQILYMADNLVPAYDITLGGSTSFFRIVTSTGNRQIVFNESSIDCDFRIESDLNTHSFFMEGATGKFGINTSSVVANLNLKGNTNLAANSTLIVSNSDNVNALTIKDDLSSNFIVPTNTASAFKVDINGGANALTVNTTTGAEVVEIGTDTTDSKVLLKSNNTTISGSTTLTGIGSASISTTQHNYALPSYSTSSIFRLNATSTVTVTGFTGGVDGRIIYILNTGTFDIVLSPESANSTAANRILCPNNIPFGISPNGGIALIYDGTSSRWRVLSK